MSDKRKKKLTMRLYFRGNYKSQTDEKWIWYHYVKVCETKIRPRHYASVLLEKYLLIHASHNVINFRFLGHFIKPQRKWDHIVFHFSYNRRNREKKDTLTFAIGFKKLKYSSFNLKLILTEYDFLSGFLAISDKFRL